MITRSIQAAIQDRLKRFPVIGIIGPRQVGKSTLVKFLLKNALKNSLYLDLELPSDQNALRDPELFFRENINKTLALDEIQLRPGLFPVIRSVIDIRRKPARFIVTGSASPSLLQQGAETLAGRIVFCELHPFSLSEIQKADYRKLWLRGGFPASYLAKSNAAGFEWLNSFINTYVQRDLPGLGLPANRTLMIRLLQMISHTHGSIFNYSTLSRSLGVSVTTVLKYIDMLEDTFVIRRLPAFHVNLKKRIVKAPKAFIRDTGLLHSLWNVNSMPGLLGHHLAGHSWEGFVIQQIAANLKENAQLYYYRTQDGAEADLVITQADKPFVCVEIKLTDNPALTKGNHIALQDLKAKHNFIVTPSAIEHAFDKNIRVVDLNTLIMKLRQLKLFY